ncbi:hypothetical protein CSA56_10465 [candidate division KSB3 bacterium]|uniref:Uncharacterized protein n=1 Tax=candidate division KSB3 bacterium TaxID=2044937 RepID=A0A2G6KED5_9BACT|nr:MAG: hypothetical protein CSA56_10465 [candidate division KSB3 bacterium]
MRGDRCQETFQQFRTDEKTIFSDISHKLLMTESISIYCEAPGRHMTNNDILEKKIMDGEHAD